MFLWTRKMQFSQPCRKTFAKTPGLFRSTPKKQKTYKFSENVFSLTMSLWKSRTQFWQPCRKFYVGISTFFRLKSLNISELMSFLNSYVLQKWLSGQAKCMFSSPPSVFLLEVWNSFILLTLLNCLFLSKIILWTGRL